LLGGRGGNMLAFELHGGRAAANTFARAASGISFAPTLGDVGTTLSHPASSSHRALSPQEREKLNISEGFFRISAGVEPTDALVDVLKKAAKSAE
ncbi:MAG: PLP-dependent transferase, partial [Rhodobacteraceae bacterium]|nr:PLP-dependent transferase [Paracoccaceae bacterium]